MKFEVVRNPDTLRLRKLAVTLYDADGKMVDKRYMFAFPLLTLAARLKLVKKRMLRLAAIVQE